MAGITNFKIDQAATFKGVAFLACQPKTGFQSTTQDTTKDGIPKWEIQIVATVLDQFGKVKNEVLKIGVASIKDPGQGLMPYTPVHLVGFEVGVMDKTKRGPNGEEKIIGSQVWYRADEVRPITATKAA